MKKWLVFVTVLVAVCGQEIQESSEEDRRCTGGELDRWREGCKWCTCDNGEPKCEPKECTAAELEEAEDLPECSGKPVWFRDCNSCRCFNGNAACTRIFCGTEADEVEVAEVVPPASEEVTEDSAATNVLKKGSACSAQERVFCPETRFLSFMAAKGCKPVYKKKKCCAVRFKCKKKFQDKIKGRCFYKNRFYEDGEKVKSDETCVENCRCEDEIIKCERTSCRVPRLRPGCFLTYTENQCCFTGVSCVNSDTLTCGDKPFQAYEGQKFFPEKSGTQYPDFCQECICTPSFAGSYGPGCRTVPFLNDFPLQTNQPYTKEIREKILAGCVPVSDNNDCSASEFVCPGIPLEANQGSDKGGKNKCKFGDIYLSKGESLKTFNPKLGCSCVVPPDLFCYSFSLQGPP